MENQNKYPALMKVLGRTDLIVAFTVDDLARSLKKVEDAVRKFEVANAKDDGNFWKTAEQKRQLVEIRKILGKVSDQLNRLLGLSI